MEKKISREVSSTLPIGLRMARQQQTSKLKLEKTAPLSPLQPATKPATLTPVGRAAFTTTKIASKLAATPRIVGHGLMVSAIGAVVLTGSTGHPSKLNPVASQVGYGSVMEQAAAAQVAAQVADNTNLLVSSDAGSAAKTLNAQVSLPTSDDATLAKQQVVDTAGSSTRGLISYAVKSGDTLGSIASQFNITSDTVRWANNITDEASLKPGQNLVILPISGLQYKVQPGDSAQSIADKFQSNADQIIAFNNDEVSGLQPNQDIIIPDGVKPQANASGAIAAAPAQASAAPQIVHAAPGGPNGYAYGYCTWYVATRRAIPGWWGNANQWYSNAQISGFAVGSVPRVGAIAWTGAGYYGHVAYVESVSGSTVTVSEMNYNGNWGRKTFRTTSASSFRYIY